MTWWLHWRRRRWLARVPASLRSLYAGELPARRAGLDRLELLALDLETSGLDCRQDRILSVGWCRVTGGVLRLGSCGQLQLRSTRPVGDSALVHGLRDVDVAAGREPSALWPSLSPLLAGRVLLAHGAAIERGFLDASLAREHGAPLLVRSVCTLRLEARLRAALGEPTGDGGLTLAACRQRHGLPAAQAHDALADAVACAELFLAQVQLLGGFARVRLGRVLD